MPADQIYYLGTACKTCRGRKRYIVNGNCVACARVKSAKMHRARRLAKAKK